MKRQAFSVIELLVVISIIAMLLALVLPALNQARESTRTAVCLNNIRQLSVMNQTYADDYTTFIYGQYSDKVVVSGVTLNKYWAIDPNILDRVGMNIDEISNVVRFADHAKRRWGAQWPLRFSCPKWNYRVNWVSEYWGHRLSYAYNREYNKRLLPELVVNPSQKIQFGGSQNWWMSSKSSNYLKYWDANYFTGGHGGLDHRHAVGIDEGTNIVFYDGNARTVPKKETFFYRDDTGTLPDNVDGARNATIWRAM